MISSREFQQKLQAGQIHEALALVMQDAIELDITTRMTENLAHDRSANSEYLRTKINLLTGNIQNEVGKSIIADSSSYLKLQQLHLDRVAASHRIIQGYLQQIQAILAVLPPISSIDGVEREIDEESHNLPMSPATTPMEYQLADEIDLDDDDLDLSVDRDGEVWEEWVEDDDFRLGVGVTQPPSSPILTLPDPEPHSVRRQLNPIEVKPIAPRSTSAPIDTLATWNKFGPEYIGIGTDPPPRIASDSDAQHMDELLADLDI